MGETTLPDTGKYASLPKNFKGFVRASFEEKTGKELAPFLEKRTIFPPALGEIFNQIVDHHYDYWQGQLRDDANVKLEEPTEA